MNRLEHKRIRLKRRTGRIRRAITPKVARPRLIFNRSNRVLSAQLIDDQKGITICSAATNEKGATGGKNKEAAKKLGESIATRALEKGIKQVVLDRRGTLYHGRIAAFADAAREKGLVF